MSKHTLPHKASGDSSLRAAAGLLGPAQTKRLQQRWPAQAPDHTSPGTSLCCTAAANQATKAVQLPVHTTPAHEHHCPCRPLPQTADAGCRGKAHILLLVCRVGPSCCHHCMTCIQALQNEQRCPVPQATRCLLPAGCMLSQLPPPQGVLPLTHLLLQRPAVLQPLRFKESCACC